MEPAELAALVDSYYAARETRLKADRTAAKLKAEENRLKLTIIKHCSDNDITSIGGQVAKVTYGQVDKPVADDWPAIHGYIVEFDAFDLLQRRLHEGAVKQRWEDELEIPGISRFPVDKLNVSKVIK